MATNESRILPEHLKDRPHPVYDVQDAVNKYAEIRRRHYLVMDHLAPFEARGLDDNGIGWPRSAPNAVHEGVSLGSELVNLCKHFAYFVGQCWRRVVYFKKGSNPSSDGVLGNIRSHDNH